jgi:hypothetical protein
VCYCDAGTIVPATYCVTSNKLQHATSPKLAHRNTLSRQHELVMHQTANIIEFCELINCPSYIQYMEHKQPHAISLKHQITGYFRYINYILIIYNQMKRNMDEMVTEFNRLNLKFTNEKEL